MSATSWQVLPAVRTDNHRHADERRLWLLYAAAVASLLLHLSLQYRGEEGVYVIVAQEMRHARNFLTPTLYGGLYGRPGLFSWLIFGLSEMLGWDHVRLAARLVAITATAGTGLVLAWMVNRLFGDRQLAALAAATYLTGDVLIARGWLAYSDPLFALLVFAAIACLWVATAERRPGFLAIAALCLAGSFLTKVATGYVFYGGMGLVLLLLHPNRLFLLSPWSLLLHGLALAFPLLWDVFVDDSILRLFLVDVARYAPGAADYGWLARLGETALFPLRVAWLLMPVLGIYLYCLFRRTVPVGNPQIVIAAAFLLINLMPFWLSSDFSSRYLMPLYPIFALVMSHGIAGSGAWFVAALQRLLLLMVGVNVIVGVVGFPLYEQAARGDYRAAARMIIERANGAPIYAADSSSVGLSIVAEINTLRHEAPPLTLPPHDWQGFLIAQDARPNEPIESAERLVLGRRHLYLLCRDADCATAMAQPGEAR